MKKFFVFLFVFAFLASMSVLSSDKNKNKSTYLIETKHTKEECLQALDAVKNKDKQLLTKINWGCGEGNHTGYLMVDAASEKEATDQLPSESKRDMKVYKLAKFTAEQIESYHKK